MRCPGGQPKGSLAGEDLGLPLQGAGATEQITLAELDPELEQTIPLAKQAGVRNIITMFGNRGDRTERQGIDACIDGLRRIAPPAGSGVSRVIFAAARALLLPMVMWAPKLMTTG